MNLSTQLQRTELQTGVYSGVSEQEYFSWKACSHSRLEPMMKSPFHCKWAMEHPLEPTDSMILGSAVDCLVLQPQTFNERFIAADRCFGFTKGFDKHRCMKTGTKAFKVYWPLIEQSEVHWYCSQHGPNDFRLNADFNGAMESTPLDLQIITPDQASESMEIGKAVLAHDTAKSILDSLDETQLSVVWRENNLLCKARFDGLSSELKTIVDLKTTKDASREGFSKAILNFGYARQAAMYMRAASFHGMEIENFVFIAVENVAPFAVAVYRISPSSLEYGNRQILGLLDQYEHCEATGVWPSYPSEIQEISLPDWVR